MPASANAWSSIRPADEWFAGDVLLVARLLADQHETGMRRPLAWHHLGGIPVQRAAGALRFGGAELAQRLDGRGDLLGHGRLFRPLPGITPDRLFQVRARPF